jgi:hypothetical protein
MSTIMPDGFIPLADVVEAFQVGAATAQPSLDNWRASLLRGLAAGYLVVHSWKPQDEPIPVSPVAWGYPQSDEVLNRDRIAIKAAAPWNKHRGRKLVVERERFEGWIARRFPTPADPAEHDPMREIAWSLPMVMAWIATRNVDVVRWQMTDWRRAHFSNWPMASCGDVLSGGWAGHPGEFDAKPAFDELQTAVFEERVAVIAAKDGGSSVQVPADDWRKNPHGLRAGKSGGDELVIGQVVYSKLDIKLREVMQAWPMHPLPGEHSTVKPDSSNARTKALTIKMRAIDAAIAERWPDGMPAFSSAGKMYDEINLAMGWQGGDKPHIAHPDTIRRYFKAVAAANQSK